MTAAMDATELHVFIVNYNSVDDLEKCLASLAPVDAVHAIHIYENGSPSPTEWATLQSLVSANPRATAIRGESNIGFGPAINRLVEHARLKPEDIVWVLNPDTVCTEESVEALLDATDARPDAILSPVILSGSDGQEVWFGGGELDLRRGVARHVRTLPSAEIRTLWPCTFLTGSALMFRHRTWDALGGFREDLFLYWEDAELSARASSAGIPLFVVATAKIWHKVGGSSGTDAKSITWYYYLARNRVVTCAQSPRDAFALVFFRGWKMSARLVARAFRERVQPLKRIKALVRGHRDGVNALRERSRS
jgi:hypothetical protein